MNGCHVEAHTPGPPALDLKGRVGLGDFRMSRRLVQPPPATLNLGIELTTRIRNAVYRCQNRGMKATPKLSGAPSQAAFLIPGVGPTGINEVAIFGGSPFIATHGHNISVGLFLRCSCLLDILFIRWLLSRYTSPSGLAFGDLLSALQLRKLYFARASTRTSWRGGI